MSDRHHRRPDPRSGFQGPPPEAVEEALEHVADALRDRDDDGVPSPPRAGVLRLLKRAYAPPYHTDAGTVTEFSVRAGDPQHGAMRSDDHLSSFEAIVPAECPACGHNSARFSESTYHHIAGSYSLVCRACDTEIAGERWD